MEEIPQRKALITGIFEDMGTMLRLMHPTCLPGSEKALPSRAQIGLLLHLAKGGPRSLKELADMFCMTSSAATQLVDSLEEEKLVTRTEDPQDRRKVIVAITPKGHIKLEDAKKARLESLTHLLAPLTDEELEHLANLQKKIVAGHRHP